MGFGDEVTQKKRSKVNDDSKQVEDENKGVVEEEIKKEGMESRIKEIRMVTRRMRCLRRNVGMG